MTPPPSRTGEEGNRVFEGEEEVVEGGEVRDRRSSTSAPRESVGEERGEGEGEGEGVATILVPKVVAVCYYLI